MKNTGNEQMGENQTTDGDLINQYRSTRDESAARVLIERHYDTVLKKLKLKLPLQDAEDCAQLFWTRFFNNIDNYEDSGRFEHFISASVSNLLKEHWRNSGTSAKYIAPAGSDTSDDNSLVEQYADTTPAVDEALINDEMVAHLVNTLIPALPSAQRMVWLLNHEAEFWDPEKPLSWDTLAQLNGISAEEAWQRFESARNNMVARFHGAKADTLDLEHLVIYLIWTQAQRHDKRTKMTMKYFALLLNESENTLKTRYRATKARLDSDLTAYANHSVA